jgi:hypothetical protein
MTKHKVLIEWNKNFTGGRVFNIETDDWEGEGLTKLKKLMDDLEPKKFEEMIKKEEFKKWKQSIEYKTRYILLNSLET